MQTTTAAAAVDRRGAVRFQTVDAHRIRRVRLRPGDTAIVIDVSVGGALLETSRRLLPGTFVELQMERDTGRECVRGRVLRCSVSQLRAAGVAYRGAILFDRHLPWFVDEHGYPVPDAGHRAGRADRADATQQVI